MSAVSRIKVRYIKKRLAPVSKEVFDKVQFQDTPEEVEKLRAAEAARIDAERKAAEEKKKVEQAALQKKQEEDAKKKADEDAKKKADEDAKKKADEEAKKKAAEQKVEPKPEVKKEEKKEETPKEEVLVSSYKPPVYQSEPNFKLADSVFAKFKAPDADDFKAMIEADFKNSRLSTFFPTPEDMSKMKTFLLDNHFYSRLISVHRFYQSQSNFPQIGFNDVMNLFKGTKVFDDDFNQSKLSLIFAEANATGASKGNADRDLDRFEFIELTIRSAIVKYKHSGKVQKHREAVFKFLENDFLPFAKNTEEEYTQFRIEKIYSVAVNKVLHSNKEKIDKLFKEVGGADGSCDLKEVIKMIKAANLNQVSNREATWCFSMSQMAVIDESKGGYSKMDRKEFNEFLCRVAVKQFEGKKDSLDVMLTNLLKLLLK